MVVAAEAPSRHAPKKKLAAFSAMFRIRSGLRKIGIGILDQFIFVTVTQLVRQVRPAAGGAAARFLFNRSLATVTIERIWFWHCALKMRDLS
jgi:hypothetical protein